MASSTDLPSIDLRRTPLYDIHKRLGARIVPFAGWEMPVDYGSQLAEHAAVRERAGIFDVSHMGQVRLVGARALEFLDRLVPGDVQRLGDGESLYTNLCTPQGTVIDDLIVTRVHATEAFAVINAGTSAKDIAWIRRCQDDLGFADVDVLDECDRWAMIALQGPHALAVLETLLPKVKWSATKAFTLHPCDGLLISRTGYTGEDGAEILCPPDQAEKWWKAMQEAGAAPCGLGSRDSLRLEMGYPLYGQDMDETVTPLEAGIGWTIGWKKTADFIGRGALESEKARGQRRRRIGLVIDSRRPLRHGDKVHINGDNVGEITSGGFSPTLGVGIALALVDRALSEGHRQAEIEVRGTRIAARIAKPPFVTPGSRKVS